MGASFDKVYNHVFLLKDWMLISNEGTGSHAHIDPDLTGAWVGSEF